MRLLKAGVLWLGLGFLILHFILLIFYGLLPLRESRWYYLSFSYVYPFFHQNWELFVPPPEVNYRLFVGEEGKEKTDIFQEVIINHQANRLKGLEPLVIALTNTIHYFERNSVFQSQLNGPVTDDRYFRMVEKMAGSYYNYTRHTKLNNPRIFLMVEKTTDQSAKVYYN